jgi:hypothetical protein
VETKSSFFTDREGRLSWMRLITFLYFIFIAIPGSWVVIFKSMNEFTSDNFSWEQMAYSSLIFLIIHLCWIAPKQLSKMVENDGIIGRLMAKYGKVE